MALVVENGTGLATAESYISEATADTYHVNFGNTTWAAASTTNKEIALRKATQFLDARFHRRWKGRKNSQAQALDWPRWNVEDRDGWWFDSDAIPRELEHATAEAALRALTETLVVDLANPGTIKLKEIQVGPIKEKIEYTARSQVKWYRIIDQLLTPLIEPAVGIVERG